MMGPYAGVNVAGKEVLGLQEALYEGLLRRIWTPAEEWLKISELEG